MASRVNRKLLLTTCKGEMAFCSLKKYHKHVFRSRTLYSKIKKLYLTDKLWCRTLTVSVEFNENMQEVWHLKQQLWLRNEVVGFVIVYCTSPFIFIQAIADHVYMNRPYLCPGTEAPVAAVGIQSINQKNWTKWQIKSLLSHLHYVQIRHEATVSFVNRYSLNQPNMTIKYINIIK